MGVYLNPGCRSMQEALRSEIYVDKTALLNYTNKIIRTKRKYICVSRPRRFGKTMAADMVSAYYDRTVDGKEVFKGLAIASDNSFEGNRNRYDVISLNMQRFLSKSKTIEDMIDLLSRAVCWDLTSEYPDVRYFDNSDPVRSMEDVFSLTGREFVVVIDEWDCLFREFKNDKAAQETYLDFLRDLLKDRDCIALCYMTGILPIKKYGTHSALNMFSEFSMTGPDAIAPSVGFDNEEVRELCEAWGMPYDEARAWYDGYRLYSTAEAEHPETIEIYSPRSIVEAMTRHAFGDYWNQTETYEALKVYIDLNYDGLRDAVIALLAGDHRKVDITNFTNDMTTFNSADDVLTLLVHLGYLGYDQQAREVFIPNREVTQEFAAAIQAGGWNTLASSIEASEKLLSSIVAGDEEAVAAGMEAAHQETSHLKYNSEEALAYTLSLGLYAARQWYDIIRELPAGKGFADLVLIPRRAFIDRPAIIAELKWNQSARTAIEQIHEKRYPDALASWIRDSGKVILAGISYDKDTREHTCTIESI